VTSGYSGILRAMLIKPNSGKSIETFEDAIQSGRKWGRVYEFVHEDFYQQTDASKSFFGDVYDISYFEDIQMKV